MQSLSPVFALFLGLLFLSTGAALSQAAPAGSCMLPDKQWCWPIAPLTYGSACTCDLPDGQTANGVVQ